MSKSQDNEYLKTGDFVTFKSVFFGSYMSAEGILLEDVNVNGDIRAFSDAVFCVHLQRKYSASRELADYLSANKIDVNNIDDENTMKYLKALQRGRDNENALNDTYMRNKLGQFVTFGDVIQLFHVKSRKYLRVQPDKLAKGERENLRVSLDSHGDIFSWLQISPRYKIDRDGDQIPTSTELYLRVFEKPGEFIHCADRTPQPNMPREVNCSLEACSWRLSIFQSVLDALDRRKLLSSKLVYINDPEKNANLSIAKLNLESLDNEAGMLGVSADGYAHDNGNIVLEPMEGELRSSSLWFIESKKLILGGNVEWKTEQVRLKHLNTGLYLLQDTRQRLDDDGMMQQVNIFTITHDASLPGTLFSIPETNGASNLLNVGRPIQICQSGVFIKGTPMTLDDGSYIVEGSSDSETAINFKIYCFSQNQSDVDEESDFYVDPDVIATGIEPLDVYVGVAARNYLMRYHDMIVVPKTGSGAISIWPRADASELEFFHTIVDRTVFFLEGFPISSTNIVLDVDKGDPLLKKRRQKLVRDQLLLEYVLRIIHKLIPLVARIEANQSEDQLLVEMSTEVIRATFNILYSAIKDDPENQMYVADHMPALLAHLSTQPLSGKCVTEMLANNIELQETKIGTREMSIFVEKLHFSEMKTRSMYLNLLQACCSCQGDGVDTNQCKITNMLFAAEDTDDIVMKVQADFAKLTELEWGENGLYIPMEPDPEAPIFGDILLSVGLPNLSIGWQSYKETDSCFHLFGTEKISLMTLFDASMGVAVNAASNKVSRRSSVTGKSRKVEATKNTVVAATAKEIKQAVARYFVSELNLAAEMCMDRNYVAMNTLDRMFPYEVLITILKLDMTSDAQAAAARLLLCLHIDKDPQAATKIPRLTRAWSDIKDTVGNPPKLPSVERDRENMFALIQQLVSEHCHSLHGKKWSYLSVRMMQILNKLVSFNFYNNIPKMNDVICPLVKALDRRSVVGSENSASQALDQSAAAATPGADPPVAEEMSDDGEEEELIWEAKLLTFLESFNVMVFILSLVCVAVGITLYLAVENKEATIDSPIGMFQLAVLGVFCVEISSRCYCFVVTRDTLLVFLKNVFNQIDIFVILIDIVFLALPANIGSKGGNVKVLRLIRLMRLLRILRAARAINALATMAEVKIEKWKLPTRYRRASPVELETMIEAMTVLTISQNFIEDRNLTLFLRYFHLWECGKETKSPGQIFAQVLAEAQELSMNIEGFDDVFMDLLMYESTTVFQETLDLIMAKNSVGVKLIENAAQVQLMISSKHERVYKFVDQMLQQLERNAETQELWGELQTEEDIATSNQSKEILKELIALARIRREVLEFDQEFTFNSEIQNLYRNQGCFSICFKVLGLMDSIEEGEEDLPHNKNTIKICSLCNILLYWFFCSNPQNQELGFEELDFFLEMLDKGINSHLPIQAIFKNNEKLIKLAPLKRLNALSDKICKCEPDERSPFDLALFRSITHVDDKNEKENQLEIMKQLTSPDRLNFVTSFFVPISHPDYARKRELMEPFLEARDVSEDMLPRELSYHLVLMDTLAACTIGRYNITTVEAKVQSIFKYDDVIDSILDPGTLLLFKVHQSSYLYNAVMDVNMTIPGLEYSGSVWRLLDSYTSLLSYAKDELRVVEKEGWSSPEVSRQQVEYVVVSVMIVSAFFSRYYKKDKFRLHDGNTGNKITLTMAQINDMIVSLFNKIRDMYEMDSPRLSGAQKQYFFTAIVALNEAAQSVIVTDIKMNEAVQDNDLLYDEIDTAARVTKKYKEFMAALESSEEVANMLKEENMVVIHQLENLPRTDELVEHDARYEVIFKKLVNHVRENLVVTSSEKTLNPRCTTTTIWTIKSFRAMIENAMGMTIEERDEEGGEEQDRAAAPVIATFIECGAVALCLDLIAVGINENLQLETMKLCIGMLFKEGGAKEIQQTMNNHLRNTDSTLFFKQLRLILAKLIGWHEWHGVFEVQEGESPTLPVEVIALQFLQLMAEGHFLPNQNILREQPQNSQPQNLLDDLVNYLNILSRLHCRTSTTAAISVCSVILEAIQGPSTGNQVYFCLETELLEIINRLLRSKLELDCDEEDEIELKKCTIEILQALLEGQTAKGVVFERLLSVIHLDIILMTAGKKDENEEEEEEEGSPGSVVVAESESMELLKSEALVLVYLICDFEPSLRKQLKVDPADAIKSNTVSIEVMWNGLLQRRYFHVPDICKFMAKSSMDNLVEAVDRTNLEVKLIDFLERVHRMYRQTQHEKFLTDMNVSAVFSQQNHERATWVTFVLTCIINLLYVIFYVNPTAVAGGQFYSHTKVLSVVINVLNGTQASFAFFTLLQSMVVRAPLEFQKHQDAEESLLNCILYTSVEPLTLYYAGYALFVLMGIQYDDFFITFLLLDLIKKNEVARNIFNSVYKPRAQLIMTFVLGVFALYIFAIFTFIFKPNDIFLDGVDNARVCATLWGCFKVYLGYGLRNGGGIADSLVFETHDYRNFMDILFFIFITLVLLQIIFGIILDTFTQLRFETDDRVADTTGLCFMCGIEKLVFDRAGEGTEGFITHIKNDHLMWNYVRFIIFIWEQDKDDDDGLEQYVRRCIESGDITWFPMNKALCLRQKATMEEVLQKELMDDITEAEKKLDDGIKQLHTEVGIVLSQLRQALNFDKIPDADVKTSLANKLAEAMSQTAMRSAVVVEGEDEEDVEDDESMGHLNDKDSVTSVLSTELGTNIQLQILDFCGSRLTVDDVHSITCRVVCDKIIHSVRCQSITNGVVTFMSIPLLICYNARDDEDDRRCNIQIVRTLGRETSFLTSVEFDMLELLSGRVEEELSKRWENDDGVDDDAIYGEKLLRVRPICQAARHFGRLNGGDA